MDLSGNRTRPPNLWSRIVAALRSWFDKYFAPRQTQVRRKPRIRSVPSASDGQVIAEARARRNLAQPAKPQLIEEPGVAGPAPWDNGGVAPSIDPDEVRPHLMEALFEMQEQCETDAGKAFFTRLLRLLGTDQLDLPPFPDVAWQLDSLLRLGDPPLVRVVKLVRREAALVRRVWTQACSAFYARPPNSLDHAVARIGFDALWRIGMSACLYSEVFRVRGFQEAADGVRRHGIIAADVAAWLSGKKLGAAYLAGLLHNVGKLMIYRAASTARPVGLPDAQLVEDVATKLYPSIGVLVAHAWKLGPEVAAGIGFHHDPTQAPPQYQEVAMQVQVSNIATYTAEFSRHGQDCGGLLTLLAVEGLQFDVARTIGKAHEIMDGMEQLPDAANQPVLDVVEKP